MNFVEPIRDKDLVRSIAAYLRSQNERDYIMFMIGIYAGLRISDILKLRVSDVKNRDTINIREKKNKKQKLFRINPILKKEFKDYCADKDPDEMLISRDDNAYKAITRQWAYMILKDVAGIFKLENIGCHTMRKTFGYHFYLQTKDIATLQKIFNHSTPMITLRYIGIEQDSIDRLVENFKIF